MRECDAVVKNCRTMMVSCALVLCLALPLSLSAATCELPLQDQAVKTEKVSSKRGEITVFTHKPTDHYPRYRILTEHYEIYSELKGELIPPGELGQIMEAMWEQYAAFFGTEAKQKERWKVEIYASPERFGEHCPNYRGANGVFLSQHNTAFTHYINVGPVWWTRALLVHEAGHQYHIMSGVERGDPIGYGSSKFKFLGEGVACFTEGHRWDADTETMVIGSTLPGRSRHGHGLYKNREHTFEGAILANVSRDEAFNLTMFLIHKYPAEMAKLMRDNGDPAAAWKKAFGTTDMPDSFWEAYDAFQTKIGDESTLQDHGDIEFRGWGGTKVASAKPAHAPAATARPGKYVLPVRRVKDGSVASMDKLLLAKVEAIAADGRLPRTQMRLHLSSAKLALKDADSANGTLTLAAGKMSKDFKLTALKMADRATIAALLMLAAPEDTGLQGVRGFYLECAGQRKMAAEVYEKAGSETQERIASLFQGK